MPNTREKLIELIALTPGGRLLTAANIADHLIANGVTVQDSKGVEIDQFSRWIPVTERLPEADRYVLVITAHGSYKTARCNFYKNGTEVCWATNDGLGEKAITHWMALPQPPKEE